MTTDPARRAQALGAELNPQQLAAVTHGEGPQLVLAGAGSGKTRVITHRVAWLVRELGIEPSQIAAVTFTNKAAGEMRDRVEALIGGDLQGAFVGTFHRFALGLLRRHGERVGLPRDFAIFDASDQRSLVKKAIELEGLSDTAFPRRSVLARISAAKNRMLDPGRLEAEAQDFFERKVAGIYRRYQGLLLHAAAVDFDDMLFWTVRLFREHPEITERWRQRLRYLLVDEFQDTNQVQLELVKQLVGPAANLTAVGDEDQGIYRWRGAELDNILDFERHFPGAEVRRLEQNYRSTQTILDAAGAVVQQNRRRRGKRLWTEVGGGEPIRLYRARDEGDEAAWIVNALRQMGDRHPLHDTAVLVRTHAQTRALEEELLRHGIPYTLVGGVRFYERAEIKDLVAYLRLLRNPRDTFSLERVLNQPPRGIGQSTRALLLGQAERLGVPVWDAMLQEQVLDGFPPRAASALRAFRDLVVELQDAARGLPLPELLRLLLERTGYGDLFDPEEAEGEARLENLQELISAAQEHAEGTEAEEPLEQLTAFLDHASLATDIDAWQQAAGGVSLMTLHSAKGLEFPVVVIAGLEEGLLPHFNAQGAIEDVEEERRLLYVGMTRAERRLLLTCCRRRRVAGRFQNQEESEFLSEIPERYLEVEEAPRLFVPDERSRGAYSFFGRPEPTAAEADAAREAWRQEEPAGSAGRGTRVRHPSLGEGTVMTVEGSGEDRRLTVYFERWGKRKLVAKFAKLEILG